MFKKTVLDGGLRIITVPLKETAAVTILVLVGAGSKYETLKENGISHFIEHMLGKGTKKRPDQLKIGESIDKIGGRFNFGTSKEDVIYWVKVRAEYFEQALDWISDILLHSKFEEKEIEKEKNIVLQELKMYLDEPSTYVWTLWEKLLYGNQPAGRLISGQERNIKNFKREQILDYLNKHYSCKNTIICVSGKIDQKIVETKIRKYFKNLRRIKPKEKLKAKEIQKRPKVLSYFKETDQTHLCIGVRTFSFFHPSVYAQEILATILGGNVSSRLFNLIRTRKGLAYYISTSSDTYTDTGYLVTGAGTAHENVEKAISLILKEYNKLKIKKVSSSELQRAKDFLKGNLSLSLESSDDYAAFYGSQELFKNKILKPEQIFAKIDKVSKEEILNLAKRIFTPKRLNLALIGPFKDKTKFKNLLKI